MRIYSILYTWTKTYRVASGEDPRNLKHATDGLNLEGILTHLMQEGLAKKPVNFLLYDIPEEDKLKLESQLNKVSKRVTLEYKTLIG